VEANSTGGQGSRRAVAPNDDDDDPVLYSFGRSLLLCWYVYIKCLILTIN
jgi:hypothetical protein